MSDSAHRTMREISVYYFTDGKYKHSKFQNYLEQESELMYQRTLNKFKETKEQVIIAMRDEFNSMVKSIRLNF